MKEKTREKVKKSKKSERKTKLHSIRTKIIGMLLLISLLPVSATGISSYFKSTEILYNKLETTSEQMINEVSRGIDNYFSAMSNLILVLSKDTNVIEANNPIFFDFAKGLIANVKDTDDNILAVYVGTESNIYYNYPQDSADNNFKSRDWYVQAMANPGQIIITNPYISKVLGKNVVSIARTIENNTSVIGVVAMDIDLAMFSTSLSEVKVGNDGYIFVADNGGNLISHPQQALIATNIANDLSFWAEATTNHEGFTSYEYKGEDRFGAYHTSEITGWKIVATMGNNELTSDTQTILNTFLFILVFIIIIAIVSALLFSNPISRNVKTLLAAFNKVSNGDMTVSVTIKTKDEFDLLGQQFNGMVSNVSGLIQNVSTSSETVLATSISLANMSEETNASVNEVARAVEEVAHGATEQAQNSVEGATSISELSDKLNLVNDATDFIDGLSKNTSELTYQGLNKVETLIEKSNVTKTSTDKVSELVYTMSESMNQIFAISDTIDAITAQTNLLALNASIEAARAGEAGKGFAVVADEIRNLAEQSKSSTVKIKTIVEDIKQKTEQSVDAMNQTGKSVEDQVIVVDQTQSVFREIMDSVNNLTNKVSEIKSYTMDIATKKESIVAQIENISAISEESASASQEVTASTEQIATTMEDITKQAENLKILSEDLQNRLNNFKLS